MATKLVGFGPPTKVNFSDIIKLSNLKNPPFGGAPCIVLGYISCISRVIGLASWTWTPNESKFQ